MTARTAFVAVAWLAAMAGAAALVFAATAGIGLAGSSGTNFSVIFGGVALAAATDASVGAALTLRRPGNIVGVVLMLAAILLAATRSPSSCSRCSRWRSRRWSPATAGEIASSASRSGGSSQRC